MGLELDEDRRHGVMEALKGLHKSRPVGWRPFRESYIGEEGRVHVHLRQGHGATSELSDASKLCALFEWPRGFQLSPQEVLFWGAVANDVVEDDVEVGQVKVAMLVDVPEFVQDRKRLERRVLPVVKRLQPLEVCAQTWVDSPEALRFLGGSPRDEVPEVVWGIGVGVDRETGFSPFVTPPLLGDRGRRRVGLVGESQSPDQMIEC